ncbi:MAG: hypothetical protein ABGX27_04800 [Desulfurobacteriaceae bacterium]
MNAVKVLEELLSRNCDPGKPCGEKDFCIVCASSMVYRISELFPESFIVSNTAFQVLPNLASIYYAVNTLKAPLVAIAGTTKVNLKEFLELDFQVAEVEFKLLRKVYENNIDILYPLYEENEKHLNAALVEINIDAQIDYLLSVPEFENLVSSGKLVICGLVLDKSGIYGDRTAFYLINLNGLKDPDEVKNHDTLEEIPESIRKQKVKRFHVQF